jgi:hypothetical protein
VLEQLRLAGERPLATDSIQRAVSRGDDDPGRRIRGNAVMRPPEERRLEGVLKRVLGELEVTEDANQGRKDARTLLAEDAVDG